MRLLARMICRVYALFPFVGVLLVGGILAAVPHGVAAGLALTTTAFIVMAVLFADFRRHAAQHAGLAALYAAVVVTPAAVLPFEGVLGFAAGIACAALLVLFILFVASRLLGPVRLELYPDIVTGLLLIALFYLPVRVAARRRQPREWPRPPYDVAVLVCSYAEEATIERCLSSIESEVARAAGSPLIRSVRVCLADSSSPDRTRERAARFAGVVIVDAPPGKLSARHAATLQEQGADVIVCADGDREYEEGWLLRLLAPLAADPNVVATMGETSGGDRGLSGSALSRRVLSIPMNAGNSAYYREAYALVPFALEVDQFRHKEIWTEEEFLFSLRLQALGRIAHVVEARSFELRPYSLFAQLGRHLVGQRLRTF